jgi:hypothetical protein
MLKEFQNEERVVHCKREKYDVYIGRPSFWGNPFTHIRDKNTLAVHLVKDRKEALEKYREYVLSSREMIKRLPELKGKILGCWCHPRPCHGEVLIQLLREVETEGEKWMEKIVSENDHPYPGISL